jgi:multidrug transporter EmrE-like cation transporter
MIGPMIALAAVVLLSAAAQVLLKRGVSHVVADSGIRALISSVNPSLLIGALALLAAPPLYFFVLTRLELGLAFAGTALTQGVVALAGWLLLHERLQPLSIVGLVIIIAGLLVWNL